MPTRCMEIVLDVDCRFVVVAVVLCVLRHVAVMALDAESRSVAVVVLQFCSVCWSVLQNA